MDSVQALVYWSIVGHLDEFVLGMVFQRVAGFHLFRRHGTGITLAVILGLNAFWHWLNWSGGFFNLGGRYPSPSPLWIIIPTIQGLAYGAIIAGYENASFRMPGWLDRILAKVGEVSYSTYLWHYTILAALAAAMPFPKDLLTASLLAVALFIPMIFIAMISYEVFEKPFLPFRKRYTTTPFVEVASTQQTRAWYEVTPTGRRLALASATKPMSRTNAERMLMEFLARVESVNASPDYMYSVKQVQVFGSYLTSVLSLNDIDLVVELQPRLDDWDQQQAAEHEHTRRSDRYFSNRVEAMGWPRQEVLGLLKARSHQISLHEPDDGILQTVTKRVIFPRPSTVS